MKRVPSAKGCSREQHRKIWGDYSEYPRIPKGYKLLFNLCKQSYQEDDLIWHPGITVWEECLLDSMPCDGTLLIARKITK